MGMNAGAEIVFGVVLEDEFSFYDDELDYDAEDLGEWVRIKNGEDTEKVQASWRDSSKIADSAPVCITTWHCDYPEGMVAYVRGSDVVDCYSGAEPFDPAKIQVSDEDVRAAKEFCALYGIPFEEPQWLLVATYG